MFGYKVKSAEDREKLIALIHRNYFVYQKSHFAVK